MAIVTKLRINDDRIRRLIEVILFALWIKYLALLVTMHVMCPGSSQLFLIFAVEMIASLAVVHFIKRLNWMLVSALLALPVWSISGNMFLFLDSMKRRAVDLPFLHGFLGNLQSAFILLIPICILVFIVGLVGGLGALIREYRAGKHYANDLPGKGF